MNNSKTLVADMDDVLVEITPKWMSLAKKLPELTRHLQHLPDNVETLSSAVLGRPIYDIEEWTIQMGAARTDIQGMAELYNSNPRFYDDLPRTKLCNALLAALQLQGRINHIHIISHVNSTDDAVLESKKRWISKTFKGFEDKYTLHLLEKRTPKNIVMREHAPKPDAFIDDAMYNVVAILTDEHVAPKEIMIPEMGHNKLHSKALVLARLRNIALTKYGDNFQI